MKEARIIAEQVNEAVEQSSLTCLRREPTFASIGDILEGGEAAFRERARRFVRRPTGHKNAS